MGKTGQASLDAAVDLGKTRSALKKSKLLTTTNERKLDQAINRKVNQGIKTLTRRVKRNPNTSLARGSTRPMMRR